MSPHHEPHTPEELRSDPRHNGEQDLEGRSSALHDHVVLLGLSVCRLCGRYESELAGPCESRLPPAGRVPDGRGGRLGQA